MKEELVKRDQLQHFVGQKWWQLSLHIFSRRHLIFFQNHFGLNRWWHRGQFFFICLFFFRYMGLSFFLGLSGLLNTNLGFLLL